MYINTKLGHIYIIGIILVIHKLTSEAQIGIGNRNRKLKSETKIGNQNRKTEIGN